MSSATQPKTRKPKRHRGPAPTAGQLRAALAAFRRAQARFYDNEATGNPYPGDDSPHDDRMRYQAEQDHRIDVWQRAKHRVIRLVLASVGDDWDPEAFLATWFDPAAVTLPDGTVLAVRISPECDYGHPGYTPVLLIAPPERHRYAGGPKADRDRLRKALARAEASTRQCAEVCLAEGRTREAADRVSTAETRSWELVWGLVAMANGVEEGPAAVILDGRVLALIPRDGEGGEIEAVHEHTPIVSVPADKVARL